jgi:nucleoside-diphosphate-sugar epimerase
MKPHILVTGAAGYLGSVLCEHLLKAEYRVTTLDKLTYGQHSLFPGFWRCSRGTKCWGEALGRTCDP